MRYSIGVDLHKHQFTIYVFKDGAKGKFMQFPTTPQGYKRFTGMLERALEKRRKVKIAVESTGNTRFFKTAVEKTGVVVKVIDPRMFKVVCESANKTDRRDAKMIAEFLDKDFLPEVSLCSDESQRLRRLVVARDMIRKSETKLKNQLHGIFLEKGIETTAGQFNSKKGLTEALELLEDIDRAIARPIVDAIFAFRAQALAIKELYVSMTENDAVVKRIRTIPGAGDVNSVTIRAFMDDPKRYVNGDKFAAYMGLAPYVKATDKSIHIGGITRRGPKELRTAFVQLVLGMVRCKDQQSNALMVAYRNLKMKRGSGKAIVAIARRLAVITWTIVSREVDFAPSQLGGPKKESLMKKTYKLKKAS